MCERALTDTGVQNKYGTWSDLGGGGRGEGKLKDSSLKVERVKDRRFSARCAACMQRRRISLYSKTFSRFDGVLKFISSTERETDGPGRAKP